MKFKIKGWTETLVYIVLGIFLAYLFNVTLGFALSTDLPVVAVVSTSMLHDETTPVVHYQWLEKNLGVTREQIDSWPISDGFDRGDILLVVGVPREDLKIGDEDDVRSKENIIGTTELTATLIDLIIFPET